MPKTKKIRVDLSDSSNAEIADFLLVILKIHRLFKSKRRNLDIKCRKKDEKTAKKQKF